MAPLPPGLPRRRGSAADSPPTHLEGVPLLEVVLHERVDDGHGQVHAVGHPVLLIVLVLQGLEDAGALVQGEGVTAAGLQAPLALLHEPQDLAQVGDGPFLVLQDLRHLFQLVGQVDHHVSLVLQLPVVLDDRSKASVT